MVSVSSVNLDVLELIFAYLSGNDLASIALVSRSFFAGVIPRLYSTLLFRASHSKRYPAVISPFAAIAAHPELAIHVRHVDIREIPNVKSHYNPKFLLECRRALEMCPNITSFRCSKNTVPPLIGALEKQDRLHDLRINASLTTDQSIKIIKLSKIRNLTLDFASWNLMNLLPQWTGTLRSNLITLTLFMANELNETVLGAALAELPGLLGLHIVGCAKVDHAAIFRLVTHTPLLESLSLTTGEASRPLSQPPSSLACLRNLAIDTRLTPVGPMHPPSTSALSAILTYINASSPRLVSFIVKYPDRQMAIPNSLIQQLITAHAPTLRNLSFIDCALGTTDSLTALCRACTQLERLEIWIPVRDLTIFTVAISRSSTLRTLVGVGAHTHSPGPSLAQDSVRVMMMGVPSLQKVVAGEGRIWTRRKDPRGHLAIGLERRPNHVAAIHWFMPRE
ncbi:hypothetical protein DFH08DRAFT_281163 [Mycena albidolilacea]|uniref:F-box domain-containing protein n=1 Tax=Mycena albidolilacea TaxID=1033008 RepID=A0AAD7ELW8_9AGAR|nr:hypothetical protein DFH08DRAFT_281163 [Mycena albidolilacea]